MKYFHTLNSQESTIMFSIFWGDLKLKTCSRLMTNVVCLCNLPPERIFDPSVANCDFEENLCQYYQEQFRGPVWNRVSVRPNAYRIGDHTNGDGM